MLSSFGFFNLFLPSRLSWAQNNTQCALTQSTEYPRANTTQLAFSLAKPEAFTVYVRIPAWAGAKTTLSVNGKRADYPIEPGKFLALQRTWKDGDRVEAEFEMPLRLEAVDEQNPNHVALMRGPLALFAVGDRSTHLTRKQLLAASPVAQSSDDWSTQTDGKILVFRPFYSIMSEGYRLYQRVEG